MVIITLNSQFSTFNSQLKVIITLNSHFSNLN